MFDKILGFFERKVEINEEKLKATLNILECGNTDDFEKILFGSNTNEIQYLPITTEMLLKVKKPISESSSLTIHKRVSRKKCTLLILNRPWLHNEPKYYPILIQNSTCKIIGIMLPFNEINDKLSKQEYREASELGVEWTGFVILNNFK